MRILGAILAGGQATRFGSDKALARLDGRSLIEHAAAAVRYAVTDTIICGRADAPPGLVAIPDWPIAGLGPLGGLCAALRHAGAHGFDAVLSIGCDTPVLPGALIERLVDGPGARFLRHAPIIGYWPADLATALSDRLGAGGDRAVYRWAAAVGAEEIDGGALPNINRTSDLAQLNTAP